MITAEKASLEPQETVAPPIEHRGHAYAQRLIAFTIAAGVMLVVSGLIILSGRRRRVAPRD